MGTKNFLIFVFSTIVLTGCFDEEVKTVDYYLSNIMEMKDKIKECNNNPGELMNTPNCKNAIAAYKKNLLNNDKKSMPKLSLDFGS